MLFTAFSQRGTGKAHNEDALLLDGQVHQGRVPEQGEVDSSQARFFAVADGVSSGTLPRTASRRLLELLQSRLATAPATASLSVILHPVQQGQVAVSKRLSPAAESNSQPESPARYAGATPSPWSACACG